MIETIMTDVGQFDLFTATLLNDFKVGSGTQFPIFKGGELTTCLKDAIVLYVTSCIDNTRKESEESKKHRLFLNKECFIIEEILDIMPDTEQEAKSVIKNCRVGPSSLYSITTPTIKVRDPIGILRTLTPGNILFVLQSVLMWTNLIDIKHVKVDPSESHEFRKLISTMIDEYHSDEKRYRKSLGNRHQERIERYITFMDSLGIDRGESMELLARLVS